MSIEKKDTSFHLCVEHWKKSTRKVDLNNFDLPQFFSDSK